MRAMLLELAKPAEDNPLRLVELPEPTPGPCEIRVRVTACGVCHTDLHTVEGELTLPQLPIIPGHQIVGVVDALGRGVTQFREGDRVGVPWLHWTCGECSFCRKGQENLCERARFTGLHANGGYAEFSVAPAAFALPLDERFTGLEAAPLLCAGIIGYRALRLSGVQPGERLGLFGFGGSAHIVLQIARHRQCEVYVFTRGEAHRHLARELGAAWTGGAEDPPPAPVDGAIIFAPAGALALDALRVTRKGGTVALAGITMSPIPEIDYAKLLYHERALRSVANCTREDGRELLRLAAEIPVRTDVEVFELAQANQALRALKQGKIRGAAVLKVA